MRVGPDGIRTRDLLGFDEVSDVFTTAVAYPGNVQDLYARWDWGPSLSRRAGRPEVTRLFTTGIRLRPRRASRGTVGTRDPRLRVETAGAPPDWATGRLRPGGIRTRVLRPPMKRTPSPPACPARLSRKNGWGTAETELPSRASCALPLSYGRLCAPADGVRTRDLRTCEVSDLFTTNLRFGTAGKPAQRERKS